MTSRDRAHRSNGPLFNVGLNRINPQMEEQRAAMAQRLQNQGLPVGSEAYNQELNRFDRSRGDQLENLALSSVGAGRQEQGRLFGQDLASGQFNASEARRQFGERLGATSFNAQEQGRGFRENLASNQNQFNQNLAANQFNAGESGRGFREDLAGRQFQSGERDSAFGRDFARQQFRSGEQDRAFGRDISGRQFQAGEQGRSFGERRASSNDQFGQRLASNQFNAGESGRGFNEQSRSQQQQHGINYANRQFSAGEAQRNFQNRFASEGQYFGQQQAGSQFGADQAFRRDQQGIQQNQFGDTFSAGQHQFADRFGGQQQQQQFNNRMSNQQLLGANDRFMAGQYNNQFNQDVTRRGISTGEMMQQRQDPFNQLGQLLGFAGQVGNPSFGQTQQFGPMAPNYMGQANQHFNQQQANRFNWGGLLSGAGQAGIAAFSDRRMKRNIKKLGEFGKGISWYTFRYLDDAKKRIGFMADEVQKVLPQAVHDVNGMLAVDYGMVFNAAR